MASRHSLEEARKHVASSSSLYFIWERQCRGNGGVPPELNRVGVRRPCETMVVAGQCTNHAVRCVWRDWIWKNHAAEEHHHAGSVPRVRRTTGTSNSYAHF